MDIPEEFQGSIEFRDVWFRYPMRPKHWVFKGLNLKINPKDSIAIVGESGQGKSTLILLLMRFYDIESGQILIDGIDIRKYSVQQLRQRMGLVMQEPTLFNYSVKENVLYGNQKASNQQIVGACEISNSRVFVESDELEFAIEDNVASLRHAMQNEVYKAKLIDKIGEQQYKEKLATMIKLEKKEQKEGQFTAIADELDSRDANQVGSVILHNGYSIQCGNRGSKLSGGQK